LALAAWYRDDAPAPGLFASLARALVRRVGLAAYLEPTAGLAGARALDVEAVRVLARRVAPGCSRRPCTIFVIVRVAAGIVQVVLVLLRVQMGSAVAAIGCRR
jgi:hypothetical protein